MAGLERTTWRVGFVEEKVMNANNFRMSFIVMGLAVLGGYGREVQAEPLVEIATAAEQPVEASGEATEEMREAKESAGELRDDTVITTKVKAALLRDPGTSAPAIGVETLIGGVQLSEKRRAKEIAKRAGGVIAVDNALSWTMRYP